MSDRPNALLRLGPIEAPQLPENALAPRPTWAGAYDYAADWLAQQRAISAQRGLWDDVAGRPTTAGVLDAAQQYGNSLLFGTISPRVFHGTAQSGMQFDPQRPAFFTVDPARASFYAESGSPKFVGDAKQPNVIPAYLDLKNPKIIEGLSPNEHSAAFKAAQDAGHDGVILKAKGVPDTYIAFDPSQVLPGIGRKPDANP